jgi:branched-subunit amino acid transport protein AzlD
MPLGKAFLAVAVMAAVTLFTRAFPFIFFRNRKPPAALDFVRDYIPPAVMMILALSSFKDIKWASSPFGVPELICAGLVAILHLWKRNAMLSIVGGTAVYMILIRMNPF